MLNGPGRTGKSDCPVCYMTHNDEIHTALLHGDGLERERFFPSPSNNSCSAMPKHWPPSPASSLKGCSAPIPGEDGNAAPC